MVSIPFLLLKSKYDVNWLFFPSCRVTDAGVSTLVVGVVEVDSEFKYSAVELSSGGNACIVDSGIQSQLVSFFN